MSKITEARDILKALGLPAAQQNEMSALTLLALCNIKSKDGWETASRQSLGVSKGIMKFVKVAYKRNYAPNTRETFRRQVLHQFEQARIADYNPDNPSLPVNSPKAHYAISLEVLELVRKYGTPSWKKALNKFLGEVGGLAKVYAKEREAILIPVKWGKGEELKLSAGKHNEVQAAIVEKFAPRFANNGVLVYLGDTANKNLFLDKVTLSELGIPIDEHSKLPDVVIYDGKKKVALPNRSSHLSRTGFS